MNQVFLSCAVAFLLATGPAVALASSGAQGPLVIEAAVGKQPAPGTFEVEALLRNVSEQPLAFVEWTCGYAVNWDTDNGALQVSRDQPCLKNSETSHVLKPSETAPFNLVLVVGKAGQANVGTFKLIYHARVFQDGLPPWATDVKKTDILSAPLSLPIGADAATTLLPR